ncbi:methylamine utilization protein [Methylophaga thiooxydans]|uniref:methylamine utilization protein n=1 Tax=Methylophaga thiooxydans TaxID=392484 RepID=UPI0023560A8E|nr:methylamine utilization protein [Methylophaga thiooxydans]
MRHSYFYLKFVFCLSYFLAVSAYAQTDYTFYVTDNKGLPLSDVIIEPDIAAVTRAPADVAIIDQIDKQFIPQQILIETGQLVDFPNSDNIRHHVYSFSKAKVFELKLYADTPENPIQFPEHGVVVVGCNIHDSMIGYIFVSKSTQSVMTGERGDVSIQSEQAIKQINVWHANNAAGPETLMNIELNALKQDENGRYLIKIDIIPPATRNSFEDTFGGLSQQD